MKKLVLSKDYETQIDDEDYEKLSVVKWSAAVIGNTIYAVRSVYPENKTIRIHRIIMNAKEGEIIDHIDEIVCSAKKDRTEEAKAVIVRIMEASNDVLGFKYRIKAKAYGDYECWKKA